MSISKLGRELCITGDVSRHVGFLDCGHIEKRDGIDSWNIDLHYHEGLSQLFIFGEGIVDCQIDCQYKLLKGPAMLWLPAYCLHAFNYEIGMKGWVITVPTSDVAKIVSELVGLSEWTNQPQILQGKEHQQRLSQAISFAKQIEAERLDMNKEHNIALESLFKLALINLHRGLEKNLGVKTIVNDRYQILAKAFQDKLDQSLYHTRTVAGFANLLSVTPTHLSRCMKVISGKTAEEIIHDRFELEAKRQLAFTDLPISKIAYELNFSSPSYFTQFFIKQAGETPKIFREKMRESNKIFENLAVTKLNVSNITSSTRN